MSRFAARAKARARARVPSKAARRAGSPREPSGPSLRYRLAMRKLAAAFAREVRKHVIPELERFAPPPETRTDAVDILGPKSVVDRVRKALNGEPARVGKVAETVAERTVKHSQSEFKRLGIKLREAEPRLDKLITGWRRENVDKIKSLVGHELDTIEGMLREGEGRRVESLAKDIEQRFGVTESKAELLARDQVLTLNAQITQERQQAAGIERYVWTTTGDERVRERHEELDGETFSWDDPPITNDAGDRNHPGGDYQCRCVPFPVLPELDE